MAAQRKPPKRLFKNKDVVHTYQHDRENNTSLRRMLRDHADLLQEIETILVAYAEENPDVDDRTIDEALETLRRNTETIKDAEPHVKNICLILIEIRRRHRDVSDTIWHGALRTIQDLVRAQSTLSPGDKAYIAFASEDS